MHTWPEARHLAHRQTVREQLAAEGLSPAAVETASAHVVETARRVLGKMAYDSQMCAMLAILDNRLVEMATGEGKSLAAALAAAVGALAGIPVHVLTANDYLVQRDALQFQPLYEALGLAVATVVAGDTAAKRRIAYRQPVVYVTAQELAFDYLRDRLMHGAGRPELERRASALANPAGQRPLLRGLCMAIVDEADSILIDEAQMPLVLSATSDAAPQRAYLWQAYALSGRLHEGEHWFCVPLQRRITLTDAGREHIEALAAALQPVWKNRAHREDTIVAALAARHVFERDRDYLVTDGEIRIVDAVSGRVAEGRKWSRGLHALVAIKEGCRIDPDPETLAQITFQRFFRRYVRFGGMSGTLREARAELATIYGVDVVPVALHRPCRRQQWPTRCYADDTQRWRAVVARARELCAAGRPVLIGTDSVADAQALSARLEEAGIEHAVLDARHDLAEARVIAAAGQGARVTVSTNMAGRGTDIHVDPQALKAGGLHVLSCQLNASSRLDRQLAGRAGRQGQPGSSEVFLSLQSSRFQADGWGRGLARLCRACLHGGRVALPGALLQTLLRHLQRIDGRRLARRRRVLCRQDAEMERSLSFCGTRD
jgi:preprotein translocase subunit SecA